MMIKNKTTICEAAVKGAMRASNYNNSRYKIFKMIYNVFGLIFGIMLVHSLVVDILGEAEHDNALVWLYGAATAVFLYLGMYGMDRSDRRRFSRNYAKMQGHTFYYEVDSEEIRVKDDEDDSDSIMWQDILKWEQDAEYFYFFASEDECLILDKKGFEEGTPQELGTLAEAVMELRKQQKE